MPSVTQTNITIPRNSDFRFDLSFLDDAGELLTDITDVQADIRLNKRGPIIISFTATPNPPTAGTVTLSITKEDSLLLSSGVTYFYDVAYTRSEGVTRPYWGKIDVLQNISDV